MIGDVAAIDPRKVLQTIAADPSAPVSARVQAARALLAGGDGNAPEDAAVDDVTRLALKLIRSP